MTTQETYLEAADKYYLLPEHERASLLKTLEYVGNLNPGFKKLRATVRVLKAGV